MREYLIPITLGGFDQKDLAENFLPYYGYRKTMEIKTDREGFCYRVYVTFNFTPCCDRVNSNFNGDSHGVDYDYNEVNDE